MTVAARAVAAARRAMTEILDEEAMAAALFAEGPAPARSMVGSDPGGADSVEQKPGR